MKKKIKNKYLIILLAFSIMRGLIYSLSLPPWGLLDEEQHLDYIIKVSQTGIPPVVGEALLDEEIIQSVLDTKRHDKFHWPTPILSGNGTISLEGYSYEGYQGPFFYYIFTPIYLLLPGGILDKLFIIRIILIILSSITIVFSYKICKEIFNFDEKIALFTGLLIISLPERAFSNARLSNDLFLEIISIITIYYLSHTIVNGISWKKSIYLGLLGGVGILTKITFAGILIIYPLTYLFNLKDKKIILKGMLTVIIILILSLPYVINNYNLYGDFTGYQSFVRLYETFSSIWKPDLNFSTLFSSMIKTFTNFWVIWWKGSVAVSNKLLIFVWGSLGAFSLISLLGIIKYLRFKLRTGLEKKDLVVISYIAITLIYIFLSILGFFQGKYPEIQGRFINSAIFPIIFLFVLGLEKIKRSSIIIYLCSLVLLLLDSYYLFGYLLPYHYYFSQFFENGEALPHVWNGWRVAINQLLINFRSDKPTWVLNLFTIDVILYFTIFVSFNVDFFYKLINKGSGNESH